MARFARRQVDYKKMIIIGVSLELGGERCPSVSQAGRQGGDLQVGRSCGRAQGWGPAKLTHQVTLHQRLQPVCSQP